MEVPEAAYLPDISHENCFRVKGKLYISVIIPRSEIVITARDEEGRFITGIVMDAGTTECLIENLLYILNKYFTDKPIKIEKPTCRDITIKVIK